jgi:hypothetical protein
MIQRRITTDSTGTIDLVMTYSDENYKLKQEETGLIYDSQCIDTIAGYDEHGVPYSRFTYTETDEKDESERGETDTEQKAAAFDYLTGRSDGNE